MRRLIGLIICGMVVFSNGCILTIELPRRSPVHQPKLAVPSLSLLWSLNEVYTTQMRSSSMLTANARQVCFIGAMLPASENFGVHCLDGLSGHELWTAEYGSGTDLEIGSNGLYVGYSGGSTYVLKFDFSGGVVWSSSLRGPGIHSMYLIDGQLQVVDGQDDAININGSDGSTTVMYSNGEIPILYTPTVTYVDLNGLEAIDNSTEAVLWRVELDELDDWWDLAPVFLPDLILLRTGVVMGSVYGIDRASGAVLWKTGGNIVSNVAYSASRSEVYVLSRDGHLLAIDQNSGQQSVLAEFSSVPFILNGEEIVGGYDMAFDDSTQILSVLLGDSRQLFAFQSR